MRVGLGAYEDLVQARSCRGERGVREGVVADDAYVTRTKVGRLNHYKVNPHGHLRHPVIRDLSIGPLLDVLNTDGQPKRRQKPRPNRRP
jgi:hypothetical protein